MTKSGKVPGGKKKPTPPARRQADILKSVQSRNHFYQDGTRSLKRVAALCVGLVIVSAIVLAFSIQKKSSNRYIATLADGSLLELTPLSRPNHSTPVVKNWLSRALAETFTLDYVNYQVQLSQSVNEYFTNDGGTELIRNLESSGFLKQMSSNHLVVSLVSLTDPVLVGEGAFGSAYAWMFQTRGSLTFQNQNSRYDVPVSMTITVARRNTLEYPTGLGIARIFIEMERSR